MIDALRMAITYTEKRHRDQAGLLIKSTGQVVNATFPFIKGHRTLIKPNSVLGN